LNTRWLAANALKRVVGEGKTLTLALDTLLPEIPKENDRAFVQALCYGVARWYFQLDALLAALTRKPIKDPEIRLLALLGLYQLKFSRVKPHAAVAETVAAAGRKTWAKPLLNAVLRSYQREQAQLEARLAADPAAVHAHPPWLAEEIGRDWPDQAIAILQHNNEPPPLALRVNPARGSRDAYLERLAQAGIAASPSEFCESAVIVANPVPVDRLPGFADGSVSVQDSAAQFAAPLLDLRAGQRVLDLCAAPGGKTLHILETCPEIEELVAVDIVPERVRKIRENLARAARQATLLAADATRPETWWDGRPFDRILVDAPCSATGVIRRHPDIKLLRKPEDLADLPGLQALILEAAWRMLAPGGLMVYATCSILRRENEARIAEFLAAHPDAREIPIDAPWGTPVGHGRQILTGESGMDGFFYARLEKSRP
jgi:16S rRNA (cytosine967-C5)-methyltransferase